MATSVLLFGNSALYHRFNWKPTTKAVLKRIDHANIMLLIAGTYTRSPCSRCRRRRDAAARPRLVGGAARHPVPRLLDQRPRWLYVALYLLLGWAAVMYLVDLLQANVAMMVLVIVGGLLYTAARSATR
jgi:hemolysin III